MNGVHRFSEVPRNLLVTTIAIFGAAYAAAAAWTGNAEGITFGQQKGNQVSMVSAMDVPAGMEQLLAAKIGQAVPNLDELFVFPSTDGRGFTVSMTVAYVGDTTPTQQQIKGDVDALFPAVYNSNEPVEDVEAYFSFNGDILAGAEIGKNAYHSLGTETSSGAGTLADLLSQAKAVTTEGTDSAWMEVDKGVPAGNNSGTET